MKTERFDRKELQENFQALLNLIAGFVEKYGENELESLKNQATGRHFAELVIKGMIHPQPETARERQRLAKAFAAIYRQQPDTSAQARDGDFEALESMAYIREREIRSGKTALSSDYDLARQAAVLDKTSSANHLRTKFAEFYATYSKQPPSYHIKQDDIAYIQRQALVVIQELLTSFGVPFKAF